MAHTLRTLSTDELQVESEDHILLVTLNRPRVLNTMTPSMEAGLKSILDAFDAEPSLWVVIITGAGRGFCAGADLKAFNREEVSAKEKVERIVKSPHGFASISRRSATSHSPKPMIAAVNGMTFGGGLELLVDCDLVVASENAVFGYPEVKHGVVASQGGIPRLLKIAGHQFASELLLTGKTITAQEARDRFRFVNTVVAPDQVLPTAFALARSICANSPDAVQATKRALALASEYPGVEDSFARAAWSKEMERVYRGENLKEGLSAFSEKRQARYRNPAKL